MKCLFLAVLLLPVVASKCYYTNQTYDPVTWPIIYILNPFDEQGNPTVGNCTIYADSGDDEHYLWHFQVQQFITVDDPENAWIDVFNGDGTPLLTHVNRTTSTSEEIYNVTSITRDVIIKVYNILEPVSIVAQMEATPEHISSPPTIQENRKFNPKFQMSEIQT